MIEANDSQTALPSIFLSAHELLRSNQKAIAFRFLFAGIRDCVGLCDYLAIVTVKAADQKTTAFEWVITFTVLADFEKVVLTELNHCSRAKIPVNSMIR